MHVKDYDGTEHLQLCTTLVLGFIAALMLSASVALTRDVSIFPFIAILWKNTCVPVTYNVLYFTYIHYNGDIS